MGKRLFETTHQYKINAPPEKVWQAWADAAQWSVWVQMNMSNNFSIGKKFSNGKNEGGEYLAIAYLQKISFTWEMKRYTAGSIVTIHFKPDENATICTLTHHQLQTQSDLQDARLGWNWAMDSLQSFMENNKPLSWEEWEAKHSR